MRILAFDTTAIVATCAIADISDGKVEKYALFSIKNKLTHSENLMPMVEAVFERYGCSMKDIDRIAITVGPGSFTGVRIGVSTVKGLAAPFDTQCAAVSTLEALAANMVPCGSIVCPVMDARRGQFYNALFDGKGKRLCEDRLISAEALIDEIKSHGGKAIICGDGADLFSTFCDGIDATLAPPVSMHQNALSVAVCGYNANPVSSEVLQPVYLRPSQAERERAEKERKQNTLKEDKN